MSFLSLIVAKATRVYLVTTRSQKRTFPHIMLTARHVSALLICITCILRWDLGSLVFFTPWSSACTKAERDVAQLTGSPSSKCVVYATACVYRELYGKIADRKKNCVNSYLIWNKVFLPQMCGEPVSCAEFRAILTPFSEVIWSRYSSF